MSEMVEYCLNKASEAESAEHLWRCDAHFVPPLSGRVAIDDYAKKITSRATRFEAWSGGTLVGLIAAYCNDQVNSMAYITSVSVLCEWKGKGIAGHLMKRCIEHAGALGMREIRLEVAKGNRLAIRLYEAHGFVADTKAGLLGTMHLRLRNREDNE
jgi:ribosomal protein S18 acetylase RimI-like enzyme